MTVGENIRRLRLRRGLSQEELAARVGYTNRSTIAKIEQGVNEVKQNKIAKFAEALETTPSELLGWSDNIDTRGVPITHEEQHCLNLYRKAPKYIRNAVLRLLNTEENNDK